MCIGNPVRYARCRPNRDYLWINAAGLFQPLGDHMGTECAWLAWAWVGGVACHRQLAPWQGQPQFRVPRHLQTSITSLLNFPNQKNVSCLFETSKNKDQRSGSQIFSGATDISSPLETLPVQWLHSKVNTTATGGALRLRGPPLHSTGANGASHRLSSTCDRSFSV